MAEAYALIQSAAVLSLPISILAARLIAPNYAALLACGLGSLFTPIAAMELIDLLGVDWTLLIAIVSLTAIQAIDSLSKALTSWRRGAASILADDQVACNSRVYLIGTEDCRFVKIGVSRQPADRLKQLQSGSPVLLKLHHTVIGDVKREERLHEHFSSLRMHGEWFDNVDESISTWFKRTQREESTPNP